MPDGFNVHRKLRRPLGKPTDALEQGGIDFGQAEALAFASLLTEGVHIRLTGQDTERGTFSHRHLVLHDENTGLEYTPMQNLGTPRRRSSSTTARSRRSPASASSTATRRPSRAPWSSGRPSSATSPTPPR